MQGKAIYLDNGVFDALYSVRATVETAEDTFTADDVLQAIQGAADPEKDNYNLSARRINATLATLSSHMGEFELTEVEEHVYRVTR